MCATMRQMAVGLRRAARVLDVRWPLRAATLAGVVAVLVGTFLYARQVHLSDSWIPSAAAASAGWLCLVFLGIAVWELVSIARGVEHPVFTGDEPQGWRQEWIGGALLVVGVLLGWAFFK
jgi:H+/Cl- antiporter ClcA